MYNRYIPQPDGSHRRNRVAEPQRQAPPKKQPVYSPPPVKEPCNEPEPPKPVCEQRPPTPPKKDGITGFFRQLLPKDIETADLLILLLLLLMAGDCEEDRNNALLTMALYFFM